MKQKTLHWYRKLPEVGQPTVAVREWEESADAIQQHLREIRLLIQHMAVLEAEIVERCRLNWSPADIQRAIIDRYAALPGVFRDAMVCCD